MRNKIGFTLAEVLITLGIIGVVMALTMPVVIGNSREKEIVTGLKKAQNTLTQAVDIASSKHGMLTDWGYVLKDDSSIERIYSYLKPNLSIVKDCGLSSSGGTGCFASGWKMLNSANDSDINTYGYGSNIKNFVISDGSVISIGIYSSSDIHNKFKISDSSQLLTGDSTVVFAVDVNGKKSPNRVGRDIFFFVLVDNGVVPAGIHNTPDCKSDGKGLTCAAKVLNEGKINY
ncbi:type II secretion system protein [bacterium]|nr:type II secretion system protein [bacterium]